MINYKTLFSYCIILCLVCHGTRHTSADSDFPRIGIWCHGTFRHGWALCKIMIFLKHLWCYFFNVRRFRVLSVYMSSIISNKIFCIKIFCLWLCDNSYMVTCIILFIIYKKGGFLCSSDKLHSYHKNSFIKYIYTVKCFLQKKIYIARKR